MTTALITEVLAGPREKLLRRNETAGIPTN